MVWITIMYNYNYVCVGVCFQEEVDSQVKNITSSLTQHHRLMSDVRSILKSLAKVCHPFVFPPKNMFV